jgi:hypothetical protein
MIALHKIKEILRAADIEGYIRIHDAPDDEYDSEAEEIADQLQGEPVLTEAFVISVLFKVWQRSFDLGEDDMDKRLPHLEKLARLITDG